MERQSIKQLVRRQMATGIISKFATGGDGSGWHLTSVVEEPTPQGNTRTVITFHTEHVMRDYTSTEAPVEFNTYRIIVEDGA